MIKSPKVLYIVVRDEWDGKHYNRSNVGIYSTKDNATVAAESLQGNYNKADVDYWVDETAFCETMKK